MRANSPVVSTVIITAIVIAASLTLYVHTQSLQSSLQSTQNPPSEIFSIDEAFCSSDGNLLIILHNLSPTKFEGIPSVIIRKKGVVIAHASCNSPVTIPPYSTFTLSSSTCGLNISCNNLPESFTVFVSAGAATASGLVDNISAPSDSNSSDSDSFGESLSTFLYSERWYVCIDSLLPDYQIYLEVDTKSLIEANKMRPDCGDIRFADANGNFLPYWIEDGCGTTRTKIWVKLPAVVDEFGPPEIFMYYGNPASTSNSDPEAVFEFYDDFDNLDKWEVNSTN